ncbi:hypothetical protein M514_01878 [Trichuris suis]|uniref:Uncharacterized protein n=1 Tax=Trichuris suis TaxID=68888 RepID=A0A085MJH1_9BILA|nr:hypothetical protein M513_01878 [Trichuris suis]KFD72757.1 hypothetical protein M514_01878 [Trichuris suis]
MLSSLDSTLNLYIAGKEETFAEQLFSMLKIFMPLSAKLNSLLPRQQLQRTVLNDGLRRGLRFPALAFPYLAFAHHGKKYKINTIEKSRL